MPKDNSTGVFYSTNGAPRGSRKEDIYRLNAPPNGSGAATKILTAALFESIDIRRAAAGVANQNGINAQDKDFSASAGETTWTGVLQIPSTATPLVRQGDYFEDSCDINADGSATANERLVILEVSNPDVQGDCLKQSVSGRIDRRQSARWAAEFA